MHELSLAEGVLDAALRAARLHRLVRITKVRIRAGVLRSVVPAAMETAFAALKEGTPASDAELEIEFAPLRILCACGGETASEEAVFVCPFCGGTETIVLQGDELIVETVEGEQE
jgi:hydrogenase nickel incorporation protein HypA/HybF